MNSRKIFFTAFLAIFLSACVREQQVKLDYNPNSDFDSYHSFTVETTPINFHDRMDLNPVQMQRFEQTLINALKQTGLSYADHEHTDLLVKLSVGTQQEKHRDSMSLYYGFGSSWYWGSFYAPSTPVEHSTTNTKVSIDIFDARTNKALWHGSVVTKTKEYRRSAFEKQINALIEKIISTYPPK
ncbi:MAG: DUF4136 domain-containing protein [bacterium]